MIYNVVIVSYNRGTALKEAVNKLLESKVQEIVIVDNNSNVETKNIVEELERENKRVTLKSLDVNKGASFGFYVGTTYLEDNYDECFITYLDDDAYFEKEFLKKLEQYNDELINNYAFIAPKVVNKQGTRLNMNRPMSIVPNNFLKFIKYVANRRSFGDSNTVIEASSFIGLTVFYKGIKNRISVHIPVDYFIYFDDLCFTYRLHRLNNKPGYYLSDLEVIHDTNDSYRGDNVFRLSHILSNCKKFTREIGGSKFLYPLFLHIYYFLLSIKKGNLKIFIKALNFQAAKLKGSQ